MRLIYPADTFSPKTVDEVYTEEFEAARAAGFPVSIFNFEDFQAGQFKPRPNLAPEESILYRGWMLPLEDYTRLHDAIIRLEGAPVTSAAAYALCHHLPQWLPTLAEFTAETRVYPETADIGGDLTAAGWEGCFLKDYVKSLSTDGGSIVRDLTKIPDVIEKMRKYRGCIEGGICARKIEDYLPDTERRYFVWRGWPFSDDGVVPDIVKEAAERIENPFFTVDTAIRSDGVLRIIELGDGQVSDRKNWGAEALISIFAS